MSDAELKPSNPEPVDDPQAAPAIAEKIDQQQLQHFVTTIKSAEQQVGENIIEALRHEDTVAVLTTVVVGADGLQHLVSAALSPQLMSQVQALIMKAQQERVEEEPCVGFHCLIKPKSKS